MATINCHLCSIRKNLMCRVRVVSKQVCQKFCKLDRAGCICAQADGQSHETKLCACRLKRAPHMDGERVCAELENMVRLVTHASGSQRRMGFDEWGAKKAPHCGLSIRAQTLDAPGGAGRLVLSQNLQMPASVIDSFAGS